jgi:hypothetical protein
LFAASSYLARFPRVLISGMTSRTEDRLAVGLPLLALLSLGVAASARSWSDVLVTAFTVAALAGLGGLIVLVSWPPPGEGQGEEDEDEATEA